MGWRFNPYAPAFGVPSGHQAEVHLLRLPYRLTPQGLLTLEEMPDDAVRASETVAIVDLGLEVALANNGSGRVQPSETLIRLVDASALLESEEVLVRAVNTATARGDRLAVFTERQPALAERVLRRVIGEHFEHLGRPCRIPRRRARGYVYPSDQELFPSVVLLVRDGGPAPN